VPWVDLSDSDPGQMDQFVRAAIHKCWHGLPADRQSLDEVERVFRRLVERAFCNFREDAAEFSRSVVALPEADDPANSGA
jgi:hypothetical protein